MRKRRAYETTDEGVFMHFLAPRLGPRGEEPPYADKLSIQDAYLDCRVRVYTKYKLLYEFHRRTIHPRFFDKKEYRLAGRKFEQIVEVWATVMIKQFFQAIQDIFGWYPEPGRPRKANLIFILPETPDTSAPESNSSMKQDGPWAELEDNYQI